MTTTIVSLNAWSVGAQDVEPRDLRHVQIDQDDVELPALYGIQRLFAAAHQRHVVAVHLEHAGAALTQGALVVDHEHPDAGLDLARNGEGIAGARRRPPCPTGPAGRAGWTSWTPGAGPQRGLWTCAGSRAGGDGSAPQCTLRMVTFVLQTCGACQAIAAPGQQAPARRMPHSVVTDLHLGASGTRVVLQGHLLEGPNPVVVPPP